MIPEGFEKDVVRGQGSDVTLELNTARFLVSNDMNKGITEAALSLGSEAGKNRPRSGGSLQVEVRPMFNTTETYGDFLIPAILVVILQQTFWIGLSESVARERSEGSLKGLVTGLARGKLVPAVTGKLGFYLLVFAAYAFFLYTVHYSLFSIPFRGSPILFAGLVFLFLLAVGGVGFFIASFFPRKLLALQVLGFTSYPIFLMAGYSWPTIAIPGILRGLSMAFPDDAVSCRINSRSTDGGGIQEMCFRKRSTWLDWCCGLGTQRLASEEPHAGQRGAGARVSARRHTEW